MNITKLGHLKKLSFHIDKIRPLVHSRTSKRKTPPPPPLRQNKPQLSPPSNYPKVAVRPPNRSPGHHRRSTSPEKKEPVNRTSTFGTEISGELFAALNKRQRKISSGAQNKGEPPKVPVKPVIMRNRSRSSGSDSSPSRRPSTFTPSKMRKSSSGSQVFFKFENLFIISIKSFGL